MPANNQTRLGAQNGTYCAILACREVERSLFFSTVIMVCALLPLFTMSGPEGQIFGPMADTYAFALAGALLLSLTLSPHRPTTHWS